MVDIVQTDPSGMSWMAYPRSGMEDDDKNENRMVCSGDRGSLLGGRWFPSGKRVNVL